MLDLPPLSDAPTADRRESPTGRMQGGSTPAARIYLDHAASTPCDPAVTAVVERVATHEFANPSSSHQSGQRAARYVDEARERLAGSVGALPEEIVFTSGATESNNMAILGIAAAAEEREERRRRIVTLGLEHPSVLGPCRHLAARGFTLATAPVRRDGTLELDALAEMLKDDTLLLSVQAANNEIGTIQPLAAAARLAHEHGALVHSDAAQALGKMPFDVEALDLDFASFSAHKCYGPKGVGALWVRNGPVHAPIAPLYFGGGHEHSLRPGTYNSAAIAGFGEAARIADERLADDARYISSLRDHFEALLQGRVEGISVNGALDNRLPGASSLTFEGVDADALIARLPDLDLSAASACHSGTPEPSHVLRVIGLGSDQAYGTLRIALGRGATRGDVELAAHRITESVVAVRKLGA